MTMQESEVQVDIVSVENGYPAQTVLPERASARTCPPVVRTPFHGNNYHVWTLLLVLE